MGVSYFTNSKGLKLAYVHIKAGGEGAALPALVFLEGFKSDMDGSKAIFLEETCRERGQEYLRFDYSGHGKSEGVFVEGTIGGWLNDAREMLSFVLDAREVVLVGSSMGGWIALRLLIDSPADMVRIRGVIGIAAAPDFTRDIKAQLTPEQLDMLEKEGYAEEPSDYEEPYIFTQALFDDGEEQCLLDPARPYKIDAALTLLQGKEDDSVYWEKALQIEKAFDGPSTKVIFIDEGDHSLSQPENLILLGKEVEQVLDYLRE